MKISTKILSYTLTTAFFTFLLGIGIIGFDAKEQGLKDAYALIDAHAREYSNVAKTEIHKDILTNRSIAFAIDAIKDNEYDLLVDTQNKIFTQVLKESPNLLSIWVNWELGFIKEDYNKNYGRKRFVYEKSSSSSINTTNSNLDLGGDNIKGQYYKAKLNKAEDVTKPYAFSYNKLDSTLMVSVSHPIIHGNRFVGLVGIDVSLERYASIISKIHPFKNSYAILFANDGSIIAGGKGDFVNRSIANIYPNIERSFDIQERIRKGEPFSVTGKESSDEYYISFAPIQLAKTKTPWSLAIAVPVETISEQANQRLFFAFIIGFSGLAILALVIALMTTFISRPLGEMLQKLKNLEKGVFHSEDKINIDSNDEIGDVARSVNKLIETLNNTAAFANDIGHGKLDTSYELLSTEDTLGKALLEMRGNLIKAGVEEEQRKNQEKQQNWIQKGIADSGIILRQGVDNMEEFGYNIISFLVKYIEANQGGFFVIDDFNPQDLHVKLVSAYAFDKRRMRNKRIEMTEGLVARAIHEREVVYLTNIPDGYFKITSGLGEKLPASMVMIPLIFENDVYGVIEIGSFEEVRPYQMQFLEQVSERIGAFLANLKKSIRTNMLLENSQKQAEELIRNEKEFQEHFELMQEEHANLLDQLNTNESLYQIVDSSLGIAYFTPDGVYERVNDKYLDLYFTNRTSIIGAKHLNVSLAAIEDSVKHEYFWSNLKKGIHQKRIERVDRENVNFYIEEFYSPVFESDNTFSKVICFSWDITEHITKEAQLRLKNNRLKMELEKKEKP